MQVMTDQAEWKEKALQGLDELARRVQAAEICVPKTRSFVLTDLSDNAHLHDLWLWAKAIASANTPVIYSFEIVELGRFSAFAEAFDNRPRRSSTTEKQGKKLCYSQWNGDTGASTLYVGSSSGFPSRFSQHLGRTGGAGTYSMRLKEWASHLCATIEVYVWEFGKPVDQPTLELFEQALWDSKAPMLGKRSGR